METVYDSLAARGVGMTTVEVFRSGSYESVDADRFQIELGISTLLVAPSAEIEISPRESITAGQSVRIQEGGVTIFEGSADSGGTKYDERTMKVEIRHDAAELFNANASVSETSPTDEDVLNAAISNASTQASFTLNYAGTPTSLANDYSVDNRPVVSIFRDMMDRTGRVWWVEPDSNTINVDVEGGRGQWQSIDAETDRVSLQSFDTGSVETVINDVTVIGTGDEAVTGTDSDATSQSNYGVRSKKWNVEYAITQTEADALASSLLQPDPIAEGELLAGRNLGSVEDPQVNKTIDLTDGSKDISATGLVIEQQTIEQGRARLHFGGGVGASVAESNRRSKSVGDVTLPGSVFGEGRIADDSVSREKIRDRAVDNARIELSTIISDNMADSAISSDKIADASVTEVKVDDLAISETKIQDDSIATPKLQAEAVTANEILAGTVTANEIESETITASEIAAGTIGASRLFIEDWIPVNLVLNDNNPSFGNISWNIHTLVYDGTEYSISNGSTANRYVYWEFGSNSYSTSASKPSLDADDCLVAINEGGTPVQMLQATEIHGGAIRANTIQAAEIASATITADLIDVLDLETDDLSVETPSGDSGLNFTILEDQGINNIDYIQMEPIGSDRIAILGTSTNRLANIYCGTIEGDVINPDSDNIGNVGSSATAYSEMHAHNYVTASPDTIETVDLTSIKDVDWYGNPPDAIKERAVSIGPTDDEIPEGRDHAPVELGTMANWLLETCKAQQERIDDLEQRLSALEEQV